MSSPTKGRILIVDDEANARTALADLLRDDGWDVETAADGFKGLGKLSDFGPDVVLTDLKMPGCDGLEMMRKARALDPETVFVVMTAYGTIDSAVSAMQQGAEDYLTKPLQLDEMKLVVGRALDRRRLRAEAGMLRERVAERFRFENIVGSSPPMQEVFKIVAQVAPSKATVLLLGESGTGKELVAQAIHERSTRAKGPFVKLHCASLAESLLESELFGHERGAFTGAVGRREGRFRQAHGGTLLLDEVSEIPPATQVKLLRFLQEHEFERVGGNETQKVDVRVVAATNKDLAREAEAGRFREDLYYRLNVVQIPLPSLRERASDIPLLAGHFLRKYADENAKAVQNISEDAMARLRGYSWPGNVRELENVIERAVVLCGGGEIHVEHLPPSLTPVGRPGSEAPVVPGSSLADLERYAILKTLEATGGSTSKAAHILGISTRKIQYRLHQFREETERRPAPPVAKPH
jgi:DNA-binding NtrC family response regulator